jgi:hypothetical protein
VTTGKRVERACSAVSATLAALWPHLLAASEAADGPDPATAAPHLRAAGEFLVAQAVILKEKRP